MAAAFGLGKSGVTAGDGRQFYDNVLVAGQPRDRLRHERSLEAFRHGGQTRQNPLERSRRGGLQKRVLEWRGKSSDLYQSSNPQTSDDLWALPVSGKPSPVPVVQTDALECCGRFSPDGRFAAYQSWETGRSEIYVQSFMGTGSKQRISTEGGTGPRWRRDGKELFYRAADGNLMSVSIELGVAAVKAGPPTTLFRLSTPVYVPSLDGKSFLTNIVVEPASPVTVLLNWDPTAKRRAEN